MKRIICLLLIGIVLFCGCGRIEDDEEPVSERGVINLQMRTPDTFDVLMTKRETVRDVMLIIYEPLFNVTETFGVEGVLAEECVISNGGYSATVKLKAGVKWHNGDIFTADDVIYTVNRILENPDSGYYENLSKVESVAKKGTTEVVFRFKEPYAQFKYAMYFPIEHAGVDPAVKCIGTGPFTVEKMDAGEMVLRAFDAWHGGSPKAERVKVQFLRNSQTAQAAFSAGKLHAITADVLDKDNFAIKEGLGNTAYPNGVFEFIGFNAKDGIFKDPLLRIAVSNAIDRGKIEEVYSMATASGFPVMMSSAEFSPSYETTMYNQEYAQEVIFSAGWTDSDYDNKPEKVIDGERRNLSFTLIVSNSSGERVKAAEIIKKCLDETGFIVSVETLSPEDYTKRIESGEYDAFLGAVYEAVPYDLTPILGSGGVNRHGGSSAEMDKALLNAAKADTPQEFKSAYSAIQSIYAADQPVAGLVFETNSVVTQPNIAGEIKPYPYSPYANIALWEVKEKQ